MFNSISILIKNAIANGSYWLNNCIAILAKFELSFVLPIWLQWKLRDTGVFKLMANYGAATIASGFLLTHPKLLYHFIRTRWNSRFIYYPSPKKNVQNCLQIIPIQQNCNTSDGTCNISDQSILLFVHGGAWGSGQIWQYSNIAENLGKTLNATHVLVLGYEVYPTTTIREQADSVYAAIEHISKDTQLHNILKLHSSKKSFVLSGHSSGANICALALLKYLTRHHPSPVDFFLSLSGVFDIHKHYIFESNRKVQHISPMCAAAEGEENFTQSSPTLLLQQYFHDGLSLPEGSPIIGLVHGEDDTVVPSTSSKEYDHALKSMGYSILRKYIPDVDHAHPILDFLVDHPTPTKQAISELWQEFCDSKHFQMV